MLLFGLTGDSCCGPEGVCGYGPDYCDKGCTSNCDAKAMCGEYSEDGEMPCGMNLCCSTSGWCGVSSLSLFLLFYTANML
jgi:chitinase